jgi:hypothetical protein
MISFVYGPPYKKFASNFWDKLVDCSLDMGMPWLCIALVALMLFLLLLINMVVALFIVVSITGLLNFSTLWV